MQIKHYIFCLLLNYFLLFSCADNRPSTIEDVSDIPPDNVQFPQNLLIEEKKSVKVVTQTPDGVKFNLPHFIRYNKYDDKVYVTDTWNNRIVVFDAELNYITEFGTYGQGPGEFDWPSGIEFFENGDFIVTDLSNSIIQLFNKDFKYISHLSIQGSLGFEYYIRINSKGNILVNIPNDDSLFTVMDNKWKELIKFGEIIKYKRKGYQGTHNLLHYTFDEQENLYCAFINNPVLRKYDNNNKLVYEKNILSFPPIQKQLEIWKSKWKTKENNWTGYTYPYLIRSISVDSEYQYLNCKDGTLYVLDKNDAHVVKSVVFKMKIDNSFPMTSYPRINFYDFSSKNHIYAASNGPVAMFNK